MAILEGMAVGGAAYIAVRIGCQVVTLMRNVIGRLRGGA